MATKLFRPLCNKKRIEHERKLNRRAIKALQEECITKYDLLLSMYNVVKVLTSKYFIHNCIENTGQKTCKQLEEQICCLQCEKDELKAKLEEEMCKINSCVKKSTVCTMVDQEIACSPREKQLEAALSDAQCKIDNLECKCRDLEDTLKNSKDRAENLQRAVDLYLNSINVLEAAEGKHKIEIEQQKMTISNLQEALINVKHELDELRDSNQQEIQQLDFLNKVLHTNLIYEEEKSVDLKDELSKLSYHYKLLQDSNLALQVENLNSLQDLAILEAQLFKYQNESIRQQDCKSPSKHEIKKLRQAKRCYEHVIDCFKQEMAVMSEQLIHLQEILNLSNQSCKEENDNLYTAISDLQNLCDRLNCQLKDSEKQALLENQMNQLKDAKIEELQQIVSQKNAELNLHDEAINDMRCKLEAAVIENHELQANLVSLNSKIMQLQCVIQNYELEKSKKTDKCNKSDVSTFEKSICDFKEDMQKKNRKLEKLQCEYKAQHEMFKMAQKELEKTKEKTKHLKKQIEDLKKKLAKSELNNQHLCEEFSALQEHTTQMAQRECCREQELAQYKQMAIELRQTLIELNESLAESHVDKLCMAEEIMRKKATEERQKEDLYLSCRCEIALYRKLAENFKKSLCHSERKLSELQKANKNLSEEVKAKNAQICELQKKVAHREHEMTSFAKEANDKMKQVQIEKKRLCESLEFMKNELQRRMCDNSKVQLARAQDEINTLKAEIKNMMQTQLALNAENDKLLAQVTRLQSLITPLEEKNRILIQKLENITEDKEKLKEELRELDKTNKEIKEASENIEAELEETKNERDDICDESKCVLNTVKLWLEEQRKINNRVKSRPEREMRESPRGNAPYSSQQNEELLRQAEMEYAKQGFFPRKFRRDDYYRERPTSASPTCYGKTNRTPVDRCNVEKSYQYKSPWNLGSQGTDSLIDRDSPRDSPTSFATCSVEEWYAPNYKDEDDTDYQDEEFIRRIEAMTNDLRNSNKKLKYKCKECHVSKEKK